MTQTYTSKQFAHLLVRLLRMPIALVTTLPAVVAPRTLAPIIAIAMLASALVGFVIGIAIAMLASALMAISVQLPIVHRHRVLQNGIVHLQDQNQAPGTAMKQNERHEPSDTQH